jgi:hypothetical protein
VNEPAVIEFLKKWGSLPEAAIRNALMSSFPDLQQLSPPIDLVKLATLRNVLSIKSVDLPMDGMIAVTQGGYVIELNKYHTNERQRFTCAHELGHTFFLELETSHPQPRMRVVDTNVEWRSNEEERLCNLMAAEMLLPERPFKKMIKEFGVCAANVLSLAELFSASIRATARRVVECSRFRLVATVLEYDPEEELFFTKWLVKSPGIKLRNRSFTVTRRDPTFGLFCSMADSYRGRKWISIGGALEDYFIDAVVLTGSKPKQLLALFVLENTAELLFSTPISIEVSNQHQQPSLFI